MNRSEILDKAKECINGDRDETYGNPENSFKRISSLWEVYLRDKCVGGDAGICLCADDVAAMMILLKVARLSGSEQLDTWVDIAGYAACGGGCK